MRGIAILPFMSDVKNTGLKNISLLRNAFQLGIDGIPQSAQSGRTTGTSDRKPEIFEKDFKRSREMLTEGQRRFYV
jgi:hypothetical protein